MIAEKTMLLISSYRDKAPTFRMIPGSNDCPYLEAIYIPQAQALVIFLKEKVEGLHMVPKLDDNGDPIRALKPRADGNPHKQERKLLTTSHEAYISQKEEIKEFVKTFAINAEKFDFEKYMVSPQILAGTSETGSNKLITDIN